MLRLLVAGSGHVGAGLVASFARPGGNVTGLSPTPPSGLGGKRLQLLKEAIPSIQRVAMLWNANNPAKVTELKEAESAAPLFGIETISVEVRRDTDFEGAFQTLAAARADALIVIQDP
jgi:putative tryptophan/tyrosine transport system substrate-binding protein